MGFGQLVRMLLVILQVKFRDIIIRKGECINHQLINLGINLFGSDFPCILHEGKVISELFPIFYYLCRRFHKDDLLGKTTEDKARLMEVFDHYVAQRNCKWKILLNFIQESTQAPDKIESLRIKALEKMVEDSNFLKEMCEKFSQRQGYLLGYLSVLDIVLYESSFFAVNLFEKLVNFSFSRDCLGGNWSSCTARNMAQTVIRLMNEFKIFFEKLPFYENNASYLESFPALDLDLPHNPVNCEIISKIWLGPIKFIKLK